LKAVNDSVITVLVDNSEKDISVSNIKVIEVQKPSLIKMIGVGLFFG
jgi:hypothetical protein